jgi:thioredoxin-dependent peroxiredoxin
MTGASRLRWGPSRGNGWSCFSIRRPIRPVERKKRVLIGVSPDAEKAQTKFKDKFNLPFTLLADTDHAAAEAFGVWGEKSFMGRKYMGVSRTTFILDGEGKVARVFPKVTPEGHAEEVYQALQEF